MDPRTKVLIVDDNPIALDVLNNALLAFGYDVDSAANGREALRLLRSGDYRLVVSDWVMPEMDGLELCRHIRSEEFPGYIYVILLTSRHESCDIVEGLAAGADEFVAKPFVPAELRMRLRVGERILSLETRDMTIFAMARLVESRDPETGAHLERIQNYSRILARDLELHRRFRGHVDGDFVNLIYMTSPLHDIGKVAIPDHVLRKPGPLTPAEFEIMKTHTEIGAATLEAVASRYPGAAFLRMGCDIARSHHERFDGQGYPDGLTADAIPLPARIVALADVYDALTSRRVYKDAYPHEQAREVIVGERERHFDPIIVDAFLAAEGRFLAIHDRFAEPEPAEMASA